MTEEIHWFDMFGKKVSLIAMKPLDTKTIKNMYEPIPMRYFVPQTIVSHWQRWADWRFPEPIRGRNARMYFNGVEIAANQPIY